MLRRIFQAAGGGGGAREDVSSSLRSACRFFLLLTCGETLSPFLVATAWVVRIATLQVETAHSVA